MYDLYFLADWNNTAALANIGSVIVAVFVAAGAFFGYQNSKGKSANQQVAETIQNWTNLTNSLSATVKELQTNLDNQAKQLDDKDLQITKLETLIKAQAADFAKERAQMRSDFELERKHWINQVRDLEEKLK